MLLLCFAIDKVRQAPNPQPSQFMSTGASETSFQRDSPAVAGTAGTVVSPIPGAVVRRLVGANRRWLCISSVIGLLHVEAVNLDNITNPHETVTVK